MKVRHIIVLLALATATAVLAGCTPVLPVPPWEEAHEMARITKAVNDWARGVEGYDVEAMAGSRVLAAGFKLMMTERLTRTKNAETLRTELQRDEVAQGYFRTEKGYELRLDIDSPDAGSSAVAGDVAGEYDTVNAWSVVALDKVKVTARIGGKFEVYEEATGVPRWRSDSGEILIDLVKTSAGWKFTDMTIKFGAGFYADSADVESIGSLECFGLGRLPTREGW
jgi:hypothetical protein